MARALGPTSEGISSLLPYFNSLVGAVEQGATTSDLWTAYRDAVAIAGGEVGNPSIFDMNYVAGFARRLVTGEGNLAAASGGQVIESGMWSWAPWATGDTSAYLGERYQVRYQAGLEGPSGGTSIWGVTDWEGSLEGLTKDQLWARAFQSAQESLDAGSPRVQAQLGMTEGFSLTGVDRVQIMRL